MAQKNKREKTEHLGLTDLITVLRKEIEAAQTKFTGGNAPMFVVKSVEAELNFVVDKTTSGGGGLNVHFFAVDAKHAYRSENVQKLKIVLEPTAPDVGFADANDRHGA